MDYPARASEAPTHPTTRFLSKNQSLYSLWGLVRSCEHVSKSQKYLDFHDRFEAWQVPWRQCLRGTLRLQK